MGQKCNIFEGDGTTDSANQVIRVSRITEELFFSRSRIQTQEPTLRDSGGQTDVDRKISIANRESRGIRTAPYLSQIISGLWARYLPHLDPLLI